MFRLELFVKVVVAEHRISLTLVHSVFFAIYWYCRKALKKEEEEDEEELKQ